MKIKFPLYVLAITTCIACNNSNTAEDTGSNATTRVSENKAKDFDWLLGNWQRTNDEQGKQTFETWSRINDSTYKSHGYTLVKKDTVWQEHVLLVKNNTDWYFKVSVQNESSSTDFKLTQKTDTSFQCENPLNDFPKTIGYNKSGEDLNAVISDGNTTIPYHFKKIK